MFLCITGGYEGLHLLYLLCLFIETKWNTVPDRHGQRHISLKDMELSKYRNHPCNDAFCINFESYISWNVKCCKCFSPEILTSRTFWDDINNRRMKQIPTNILCVEFSFQWRYSFAKVSPHVSFRFSSIVFCPVFDLI